MIEIDGSMGEGGGQIVRTALSLSVAIQRSICVTNIRAGRSTPGLRPQHVTAVEAAAAIGRAETSEVDVGTDCFTFEPHGVEPGRYHFDVGTAGSAILVLQTVLPPLLTALAPSRLTVEGGTHNRSAPPFEFFSQTYLPVVERMGPTLHASLGRHGFYPKGGGRCTVDIEPVVQLEPFQLLTRGSLRRRRVRAIVAHLPRHIAEREIATMRNHLNALDEARIETPDADSAGNVLLFELAFDHITEVVSGFGEKGLPAEEVAMSVVNEATQYLDGEAPVGSYLADQLLLPLALGGGTFRTSVLTTHTHTNAAVVEHLTDVELSIREDESGWTVAVE
jgi:RNA 3'-terminal phosphate cyclase (ATP)